MGNLLCCYKDQSMYDEPKGFYSRSSGAAAAPTRAVLRVDWPDGDDDIVEL